MTALKDLRAYMDALEEHGDLRRITRQVDPCLEVGAIIRHSYETKAPAPLFTRIKGAQPGHRLFGAPAALSSDVNRPWLRLALSLGLNANATPQEMISTLAYARSRAPIPPRTVEAGSAPCKQNILHGVDATLDAFPTPLLHDGDGGPYVNSWGTIIARTPDGSFTNWSIARIMMIDGKHMTGMVFHPQHIAKVWQEWADRGEDMPFALVQGGSPALPIVSSMQLPDGVEEAGFLGALLNEPMELVPCETVDLLVPANAEIVIEGHLSSERTGVEGPMGEFAGYQPQGTSMQPIYTIDAITHRDDPIWPTVVEGEPVDEFHTTTALTVGALALSDLRAAGLPITTCWLPCESSSHMLIVSVAADWRDRLPGVSSGEFSRRITDVVAAQRYDLQLPRIFVLDDDVNAADPAELMWALSTRVHPTGRRIMRTSRILPLLSPYTPQERRTQLGEKVTYDALLPAMDEGREPRSSFRFLYPAGVQQSVLDQWDD